MGDPNLTTSTTQIATTLYTQHWEKKLDKFGDGCVDGFPKSRALDTNCYDPSLTVTHRVAQIREIDIDFRV